jgi:HlyD family secretion protein
MPKGQGRVFVITSEKLGDEKSEPKTIQVGITDGMFTEIANGSLPVGAKVVTDETDSDEKKKKGKLF